MRGHLFINKIVMHQNKEKENVFYRKHKEILEPDATVYFGGHQFQVHSNGRS